MRVLLAVAVAGCSEGRLLQEPPDGSAGEPLYTWWEDVEPIVAAKCLPCHGSPTTLGAVGSLVTYRDTQLASSRGVPMHALMAHRAKDVERPMPPPSSGALSADELEILDVWSEIGAPEGTPRGPTYFGQIQALIRARCSLCHGTTPQFGAPRSLSTYADLTATLGSGEKVYVRAKARLAEGSMPPRGQPKLTEAEIALFTAWADAGAPAGRPVSAYNWQEHVRPIVQAKCGLCHGAPPQFGAPRSLVTWEQMSVTHGSGVPIHRVMAERVSRGSMPPSNQPALTQEEIGILVAWSEGGAPESRTDLPSSTPTWWRDVEPIVRRRCQTCHSRPPQFSAPVSFVSYDDVIRTHAMSGQPYHELMAYRIVAPQNAMPPPTQPQLTHAEIGTIQAWSLAGAPEGIPGTADGGTGDAGPAREIPWLDGGSVSQDPSQRWIDLYAHNTGSAPPEPFDLPIGDTLYLCWSFPIGTPIAAEEYGVFFDPILWTDTRHLHHMMLYHDQSGDIPQADGVIGPFACGGFPRQGNTTAAANFMGGWFPGRLPQRMPSGVGQRLQPTDRIILQSHYDQVSQVGRTDMSGVRLLVDTTPGLEDATTFWTGVIWGAPIDGPNEVRQGSCTITEETTVFESFPHMHQTGTRILSEVRRAGSEEWTTLSEIPVWNFRDQPILPVPEAEQDLHAGDEIRTTCYWDTAGRAIEQGDGSQDEMCFVIFWHHPPLPNGGPEGPCVSYVP
jgi:uncharacterized membrane protein